MAITITQEPEGIYPAYNDSYIKFTSSLADNFKAVIIVYPVLTFPNPFILYPEDGVYIFNLKEAVKVLFNQSGFNDSNFFNDVYSKNIDNLILEQDIKIVVYNDSTNEELDKTYNFYKAVKQIGDISDSNDYRILSFSKDGINHELTYFEGFPFHFDFKKVTYSGLNNITIKNINTGITSDPFTITETSAFRINVDLGGANNWTTDNKLPLINGLNRLEIYTDGIFKTNLTINKKKVCSGIYLKWLNNEGGYNHFLFDRFFSQINDAKEIDYILNSDFNNIFDSVGNFKSIGKQLDNKINITTKYNSSEYECLKSLVNSPSVQMFTKNKAYEVGTFIDVSIKGTFVYNNKRLINTALFEISDVKNNAMTL